MLYSKYPDSAIILGADMNQMDIRPILNCGLKLRQIVTKSTRKEKILDVLIMNASRYYNTPIIAPPIQPDNPNTGQPSDHSVPVCTPHTDRYTRPARIYKIIRYRPLPQSSLSQLGQWIVSQPWDSLNDDLSPTEQAKVFEESLTNKLNLFCPEKELKLSSHDKPFITAELKQLDRQRNREYLKRGKTDKYLQLKRQFDTKYRKASEKYLNKHLEELKEAKPGQVFKVLKRLGAQPGDGLDANTFILPTHESESLTAQQSAERSLCRDQPGVPASHS